MRTGAIRVGENVEVLGGDRPYTGTVTAIINKTECKVKYFEYDAEVSLPIVSLQRIIPDYYAEPNSSNSAGNSTNRYTGLLLKDATKGMKVQAKYALDQNYYDAIIDSITTRGVAITYTQYGNSEEVPIEYVRVVNSKKDKKEWDGNTLIPIPEKLKISPTDTEEVILCITVFYTVCNCVSSNYA